MSKQSKINWTKIDPLLGSCTDASIARKCKHTISTIWHRRIKLGIPKYKISKNGIDWDSQPLGVIPDNQIAKKLGVSREAVRIHRKAKGIPVTIKYSCPKKLDTSSVTLLHNTSI